MKSMNFSSDSNLGHHPPSSLVTPSNIMKLEPVDYSEMTDNGVAVIPNVWSSSPTSVIADRVPHHTNQGYQTAYSQPVLPLHTPYVTQSRPNSSDFTDSEDEEIDVPAGQQNTYVRNSTHDIWYIKTPSFQRNNADTFAISLGPTKWRHRSWSFDSQWVWRTEVRRGFSDLWIRPETCERLLQDDGPRLFT